MNKYLVQNWRIGIFFFFLIPSQHFLTVAMMGTRCTAWTPVVWGGNTGASAFGPACHQAFFPSPRAIPAPQHPWMLRQKQLLCLTQAQYCYLEPKHCPRVTHTAGCQGDSSLFLKHLLCVTDVLTCAALYGIPRRHSFYVLFGFQVQTMAVY